MKTAIIIVSFGRCELLQQTLSSLFATCSKDKASITVIDNGSQSHVVDALVKNREHIDNLILLNENRGKPYAWNLGVKVVNERCLALAIDRPEFYLFCDSDLLFKENWLEQLESVYMAHHNNALGILSGFAHNKHGQDIRTINNFSINVLPFPAGCCMFMHRSVYEKIGIFDDSKLIRTIDTAYYKRAKDAGFICASTHPESVIEHTGWKQRTWNIASGEPKLLK